jgi:hypothetical protein
MIALESITADLVVGHHVIVGSYPSIGASMNTDSPLQRPAVS